MGVSKGQSDCKENKDRHSHDMSFYQFMIDSLPIAVMAVDDKLMITDFNPWAEKVTGYPADEATGNKCGDILRGGLCNGRCPLKKVLNQENPVVQLETTICDRSGRTIPVRMNTAALFSKNGLMMGAVEAFEDISTLQALEREKENLISMIAHDMKGSVVVIGGFVLRLLKKEHKLDASKQKKYLTIIRREAQRLEFFLDDFLQLSRIKNRRVRLRRETISIDATLRRLFEIYRPLASERGIGLEIQSNKALSRIQADPKLLRRVFANLLDNAIKFSHAGGRVIMATQETEEAAMVKFIDYGMGVAPEELPYIFDPFHRARIDPRRRGFGVGLAAVKMLVEAHGGWVGVESQVDKGSVFTVSLPKKAQGGPSGKVGDF
ncbi:MAG: PAS domain-containing sensor histidine kinase [Deltaproteobacteria bacterium]|nr:PAS domain-containing sensor histidine kinase [Deltaproteobacteria bacterium]